MIDALEAERAAKAETPREPALFAMHRPNRPSAGRMKQLSMSPRRD
jgi:hypothetical protein